jgi:aconitate hydratase
MSANSFDARAELEVGGRRFEIFRLDALQPRFDVARLPFSLKILLENLLRTEGNGAVTAGRHRGARGLGCQGRAERRDRLHAGARADAGLHRRPGVVDLAAMRDAIAALGGDPRRSTRSCRPSW